MRRSTEAERFAVDPEHDQLLRQEQLILDVSERISAAMESAGITKADLARSLGKTKSFVTQVLAGDRNLTLRTIADVAAAIGVEVIVDFHRPHVDAYRAHHVRSASHSSSPVLPTDYEWSVLQLPSEGMKYARTLINSLTLKGGEKEYYSDAGETGLFGVPVGGPTHRGCAEIMRRSNR